MKAKPILLLESVLGMQSESLQTSTNFGYDSSRYTVSKSILSLVLKKIKTMILVIFQLKRNKAVPKFCHGHAL